MNGIRKKGLAVITLLSLLVACCVLAAGTLLLSCGGYGLSIFSGFFEKPFIFVCNALVPLSVCLILFFFIGRAWIAYGITGLLCLAIAIGNYYLLLIRNDPLKPADVLCLREALKITSTQNYTLNLTWQVIVPVAAFLACTIGLALGAKWKPPFRRRLGVGLLALACGGGTAFLLGSDTVLAWTKNYDHINSWSSSQVYISRGVLYSFTQQALYPSEGKPYGYSEEKAEAALSAYESQDIPQERKVNVIAIMRESYSDLSTIPGSHGIDWSAYDLYHQLQQESYTGSLVTNGFGGNTKDAERCFLTGCYSLTDWRSPANSYVWYLRSQGYTTEGTHPFNGWFYNRANINQYLGFSQYYFREDLFADLGDTIADDAALYDQILTLFQQQDAATPYFHFAVTYEGHGPYRGYMDGPYYIQENTDNDNGVAMEAYLQLIRRRDEELMALVEQLRQSDRPVVLLVFGDHKPTLGKDYNNYTTAAYTAFGMDMDVSTQEGFLNYYTTEYLIWANDAAKEVLGVEFAGQTGPTISPCYLMNLLFDQLGWGGGPAYMQAMAQFMQQFPVVSTNGRVSVEGQLVQNIPQAYQSAYQDLRYVNYYGKHHFLYENVQ